MGAHDTLPIRVSYEKDLAPANAVNRDLGTFRRARKYKRRKVIQEERVTAESRKDNLDGQQRGEDAIVHWILR